MKHYRYKSLKHWLDIGRWEVDVFVSQVAMELKPKALLLDLGAGECWFKPLFRHCRYVAVDLAVGGTKWDYSRLDITADVTILPIQSNVADVALTTQTLEHVSEPQAFIHECFRVLKAGGTLFLSSPLVPRIHYAPYDFYRYTRFGLEHLFKRAGFKIEWIRPQGGYFKFVGLILKHFHGYLFAEVWLRWILFPLYLASKVFFDWVIPPLAHLLDPLDKKFRFTIGYNCKCTKPACAGDKPC